MKVFKVLLILTIAFAGIYFILDRRLAYYGKNDFNFYNVLPYGIKADYRRDFEGGFMLVDESGLAIAGSGVRYSKSEFKIKAVLKYGVEAKSILVNVKDTDEKCHMVEISGTANADHAQSLDITVKNDNDPSHFNEYTWIELSEGRRLELIRNYVMMSCILSLIAALILGLYRKRTVEE